jgi:hypothetical protein
MSEKEINRTHSEISVEYYKISESKLTFWSKIIWPFSLMGRLKLNLGRALKQPVDKKKITKLTSALQSIISKERAGHLFQQPVLLLSFDVVYRYAGPKTCLELLSEACSCYNFRILSTSEAIIALCKCPNFFETEGEALKWGKLIDTRIFRLSAAMFRDAHLVQTKVAEWQDNTAVMVTSAKKALEKDPTDAEANYWLIRSYLHSMGTLSSSLDTKNKQPDDAKWERLCLAVELHKKKDFNSVQSLIPVIKGDFGKPDIQEQLLMLDLIKRVLKPDFVRNKDDVKICAKLSENLRLLISGLGWATINVALHLIINEYEYDTAYKEICKPECHSEKLGQTLLQIACFLSDNMQAVDQLCPSIATLQNVKDYLILKDQKDSSSQTGNLQQNLNSQFNDPLIAGIPALKHSLKVFVKLLSVLDGNKNDVNELALFVAENKITPNWLRWLALRFLLLDATVSEQMVQKLSVPNQDLSVLTALRNWMYCYASPSVLTAYRKIFLQANTYTQTTEQLINLIKGPDFGNTINDIYARDEGIEEKCREARRKLTNGEIQSAKQDLQHLFNEVVSSGIAIKLWWEPFVCYWLSITKAMLGNFESAAKGFQSILNSPKSEEAQGQLALLALKQTQLDDADKWLCSIGTSFPSVLYAKALLEWRKGEIEKAKNLLESYEENFGKGCTHYYLACLRLSASIYEYTNHPGEAIATLWEIHQISPSDPISAIRLSRLITQVAYHNYKVQNMPNEEATLRHSDVEKLMLMADPSCREQGCILLFKLLSEKGDLLEKQNHRLIENSYAWCQLLLRRLLDEGITDRAVNLLKHSSPVHKLQNPPPYFEETQFMVMSWHFLRQVWQFLQVVKENKEEMTKVKLSDFGTIFPEFSNQNGSSINDPEILLRCIQKIAITRNGTDHPVDNARELLISAARFAESVCLGQPLQHNDRVITSIPPLRLISAIYQLCFQPDKSNSQPLAEEILLFCQSESVSLTRVQRYVATALAQWSAKDMDEFLKHITIDKNSEPLPFDEEELWLAKAIAWFKKSMYQSIFDSEMPQGIADLTNRDACLLFAIASSRMAQESWRKGSKREALKLVQRAASTLSNIMETTT